MAHLRRIGLWLSLLWLVSACAAQTGGSTTERPAYYPGPAYWDAARGQFIDPFSGHPVRGGHR